MPKTCHDIYYDARLRRAKIPLREGGYKLAESIDVLGRIVATLERRGREPNMAAAPKPMPLCLDREFRSWARKVPALIANEIGYNAIPAIKAITGGSFPPGLTNIIEECEAARCALPNGSIGSRSIDAMHDLAQRALTAVTAQRCAVEP
jgi:hypothetical protein